MKYLLDTNICIRHLNQRSPAITQRLYEVPETDIVVCSVVKAELYAGAMKSNNPQQTFNKQQMFLNRFVSLPFNDVAAREYARIRAGLERKGQPIGPYDMQIAAIAIVHNLTVITANTREFGRVDGLQVENWDI